MATDQSFADTDLRPVPIVKQNPKPRMGVVETVYHQSPGDNPTSVESKFSRLLKSDDQPFSRKMTVGAEWVEISTGWLEKSPLSMIHISNREGENRQVIPTPLELIKMAERVVEIALQTFPNGPHNEPVFEEFADIHPGESCRFTPKRARQYFLRCRSETAKVTATVFPS